MSNTEPTRSIQRRHVLEVAFDPWGTTYPEVEPYTTQLDGKTSEELDRGWIVRRSDALGFLGTHHLVAVLPVYLRAMVEDGVWSPATGLLTRGLAGADSRASMRTCVAHRCGARPRGLARAALASW